ncbi:MAG: hypothetical protein ACD_21C00287G0001 [uncultured bacterium]|nr:MAG: hypothetical protein ACD_21C00287G0001 [uncultured bacterium]
MFIDVSLRRSILHLSAAIMREAIEQSSASDLFLFIPHFILPTILEEPELFSESAADLAKPTPLLATKNVDKNSANAFPFLLSIKSSDQII